MSSIFARTVGMRRNGGTRKKVGSDYLYSREEVKEHAKKIKTAARKPGVKAVYGLYNNHARANAPANAVMLSQELGLRLKAMPNEAMVSQFPEMVHAQGSKR
jgi:uncharacterized protein YecE (DUF72 family)